MLKARFKDAPGRQKIENGNFRLVLAKRPAISLSKDSWYGTISPGAQIIMLMLITNIVIRDSSCPRRSCTGEAVSKNGTIDLVTCSECGLRFIPQISPTDSVDASEVTRVQRIEDAKLFGKRASSKEIGDLDLSKQMLDVTEDLEMMGMSGDGAEDSLESRNPHINADTNVRTGSLMDTQKTVDSHLASSQNLEPPIMSWLSQTVLPKNPDSVQEWRNAAETKQSELKEREAQDLEVFRNVQIVVPAEAGAQGANEPSAAHLEENDLDIGPRIYYRNIRDRYPQIDGFLARRLAIGNWQRQMRLTAKQSEAERAKIRAASRENASDGRWKRKLRHSKRQTEDVLAEADEWEGVDEIDRGALPATRSYRRTDPRVDSAHATYGHTFETVPP